MTENQAPDDENPPRACPGRIFAFTGADRGAPSRQEPSWGRCQATARWSFVGSRVVGRPEATSTGPVAWGQGADRLRGVAAFWRLRVGRGLGGDHRWRSR